MKNVPVERSVGLLRIASRKRCHAFASEQALWLRNNDLRMALSPLGFPLPLYRLTGHTSRTWEEAIFSFSGNSSFCC